MIFSDFRCRLFILLHQYLSGATCRPMDKGELTGESNVSWFAIAKDAVDRSKGNGT